jgi:hypothetical protein
MSEEPFYRNLPASKDKAAVFAPAKRCIYCPNPHGPYTREHVIPRGMGGGMILPEASCSDCQKSINEIETYCMRGPFLSHRLATGLVNHSKDLGDTIKMPIIVDGVRQEREFPVEQYPKFLVLPQLHDPPGIVGGHSADGNFGRVSFSIWGDEEELRDLNAEGNAILRDGYNLDSFARMLAKMAHGYAAGQLRLENFDPLLPDFILGKAREKATYLVGDWGQDGMAVPAGVIHQIGHSFREVGDRIMIAARIRLFAELENTPVYWIAVGFLTKPLDDVLAPLGMRSVPPINKAEPML